MNSHELADLADKLRALHEMAGSITTNVRGCLKEAWIRHDALTEAVAEALAKVERLEKERFQVAQLSLGDKLSIALKALNELSAFHVASEALECIGNAKE